MRTAFAREVAAEVEDGVPDELAGAMIGHVATTVGFVDSHAFFGKEQIRRKNVGAGTVTTECEDGWVFEEEERVAYDARFARGNDLGLDAQALGVGDAA